MNVQSGNKWKAALFLSIIVLAVFIVSLGLSRFMGGPVTVAETLVLDAVNWKHDRPCKYDKIPESTLEANYSDDEVQTNEKFQVGLYVVDNGGPRTTIAVSNLTVSVQHGFVDSIELNFSQDSSLSWGLFWYSEHNQPNSSIVLSDLTIEQLVDAQRKEEFLGEDSKAFLRVKRIGEPSHVFLEIRSVDYLFKTPHNFTDVVDISTKITYFNGSVYKSLVEPVRFILGPDDNNSFETAEEIKPDGRAHEFYRTPGDVDFYKVYLTAGDGINATLTGLDMDFDLSLYSPTNLTVPAAMLTGMTDIRYLKMLEYRVDCTGWWYIQVSASWQVGLYALQVRVMKV